MEISEGQIKTEDREQKQDIDLKQTSVSCHVVKVIFVFQSVPTRPTDPAATEEPVLMDLEETEPAAVR